MKLSGARKEKSHVRSPLTNPALGRGAIQQAVGIERCAGLISQFRTPSNPVTGEGSTAGGNLVDTVRGSGGVMARACWKGMDWGLEKPSWSRGERPRRGETKRTSWPEGGRLAGRSYEPLVMRRDPGKSRARLRGSEPPTSAKGPSWPRFRDQGEGGRR